MFCFHQQSSQGPIVQPTEQQCGHSWERPLAQLNLPRDCCSCKTWGQVRRGQGRQGAAGPVA